MKRLKRPTKSLNKAEKTLVLGTGSFIRNLLAEIDRNPDCRYQITGIVAWDEPDQAGSYGYPVLGTARDLHRIIHQYQPRVIIVAPVEKSCGVQDRQLLEARVLKNVRIEHAQTVYEQVTGKLPLETYAADDIIYSNEFQPGRTSLIATRLLSLVFAGIGLIVLAPLMALIALLIRLDSTGPVFFSQERCGLGGRPFKLLKFRTMLTSVQQESEWEEDNIHRITRVGYWLRKARLDELPQFFNILKGDMNIVGPRPHPSSNFALFVLAARNTPESGIQIPFYSMRYSVRPGITGWAQVRYRYANNLHEEMEKLRFDLYYLKHCSLWLDIRILIETVNMVFGRSHQVEDRAPAGIEDRLQERPQENTQDRQRVINSAKDLSGMAETIQPVANKPRQQVIRSRDVA